MVMCCDGLSLLASVSVQFLALRQKPLTSQPSSRAPRPHIIGSWHNPSEEEHAGWRSLQLMAYFAELCFLERVHFDSVHVSSSTIFVDANDERQ
jgi:hypothetical protein